MIRTDIGMVYISTQEGVDPEKYFEFVESIKVQGTQGYFGVMAGRPIIQFEVCQKAESKFQKQHITRPRPVFVPKNSSTTHPGPLVLNSSSSLKFETYLVLVPRPGRARTRIIQGRLVP